MAPFFRTDVANYTIIMNLTRNTFNNDLYIADTAPLRYSLPETFDAYPDIVTVTADTRNFPYIEVVNDTRELIFDPTAMILADEGSHSVEITLTDNKGASRKYSLSLTVLAWET